MKQITLTEFIEHFIADIDTKILTLSEDQIDIIIKNIHAEPDVLHQLLAEVKKKRNHYFQQQGNYDYTAFKPATMSIMFIIVFVYLLYFIITHHDISLKQELAALAKKLEPLGIMFIKGKTEATSYFQQTSENTHLTGPQYLVARNLMDQICSINSELHGGPVAWAKAVITILIALMVKPTFDRIREFFLPKYKQRYEKYCLIEQKLHKAIHNLS
jgi:hypothetical protein